MRRISEKVVERDSRWRTDELRFDTLYTHKKFEIVGDGARIEWSNLIFLPFHPVFQKLVLICVMVKTYLGPLQSVDPYVRCWNVDSNHDFSTNLLIVLYSYVADTVYGIDTLLHIIHRQVTDKAMRRQYMPKSAFLLLLDILSIIPFFRLVAQDPECSGRTQLWPNVLTYNEFLIIYRIWEYYKLTSTHSYPKLIGGFIMIMYITVNFLSVFWILLTYEGLCLTCSPFSPEFDRRLSVQGQGNTDEQFSIYMYAVSFIFTHGLRRVLDNILPSTILEFLMTCLFMTAGYAVSNVLVLPKAFSECVLRLKSICSRYPTVKKIIEETKRRNPSHKAYQHVEIYYTTMWRRRSGIVHMPDIMDEIPRNLRLEIKQDLFWPLFHHSPTLRRTSDVFQRFLLEKVHISYKLPGEKFYAGSQCLSSLFFVKSGVVQLISADDGTTPILSVTSGTIFGDINFLLPHLKRKVGIRCLTYCEVLFLTQADILRALNKFPEDRKAILNSYRYKINHAKKLFACKVQVRNLERSEAEGIGWIKSRWWQIYDAISTFKKKSMAFDKQQFSAKCELPPETSPYHCAKYLGQLVLCTDAQLQTKSMFVNYRFPWILSPYSSFGLIWKKVVFCTVFIALWIYPHTIITKSHPPIISFILLWIDVVYITDLCVSLSTAVRIQENEVPNFSTIMFERCKSFNFILDIISTIWIEDILTAANIQSTHYIVQFNRLIKVYVLFSSRYIKWDINRSPIGAVCRSIILLNICFIIILSYFIYEVHLYYPDLTLSYFFGDNIAKVENLQPVIGIIVPWTFEFIFPAHLPRTRVDIDLAILVSYIAYIVYAFCKAKFLSYLYLRYRNETDYQYFVSNLKKYYYNYGVHKYLLKRLEKYLVCHYKYYKGLKVMDRDSFKHEPFEIYWKVQGEVAQKLIGESNPFKQADPSLIRELACASKYVILPKKACIILFGSHSENVTWVVKGHVKSECYDENGELSIRYFKSGSMLSGNSVLLGKFALRTYTTSTDCELIYISRHEFYQIYKRYPLEWHYLNNVISELQTQIEEVYEKLIRYYEEYQFKRYESKLSSVTMSLEELDYPTHPHMLIRDSRIWKDPESRIMQTWLLFRAITVFISITNASIKGEVPVEMGELICSGKEDVVLDVTEVRSQWNMKKSNSTLTFVKEADVPKLFQNFTVAGGIGVQAMWTFEIIGALCDCIAYVDIILKLFLSYYDYRGVLITDKTMCLLNYCTKGFLMDVIGALPWFEILRALLSKHIDWNSALLINTCSKFAHIYIIFAYFNYISDLPTVNVGYMIIKWQVVNILIVMGASHYLMSRCIEYNLDEERNLIDMKLRDVCWMPPIFSLPENLTSQSLHLIFAQSLNLAECGMMSINIGGFILQRSSYEILYVLVFLGVIFWFVTCNTLSILILACRENTLFQYGVDSLDTFLRSERVDKNTINKAVAHFRYCWMRTKGINMQKIMNKRIGMVFGQDLSYACFKTTFVILDTLLDGGETMQKQLASISTINYFLAGHEIMREMDLVAHVFVVHRGKVVLKKNDKTIIILTKVTDDLKPTTDLATPSTSSRKRELPKIVDGDIFGQLLGTRLRPVKISAEAYTYADVLQLSIESFQGIITDEVRKTITMNPQCKHDFLATRTWFLENPYDSIEYILPSKKAIQLPWMFKPTKAHHRSWYAWWLYCTWFCGPCLTAFIVVILPWNALPTNYVRILYVILTLLDILHLANFVCEFYSANLVVENNKCVRRIIGLGILKQFSFYIDALSFIIPIFNLFDDDRTYQLAKLLRLKWFIDFDYHFCQGFKTKLAPRALKTAIIFLLLHIFTCGWIYVACSEEKFPFKVPDLKSLNISIDYDEWTHPDLRKGGCARATKNVIQVGDKWLPAFVVPIHWANDYIIAMTYMLLIHTHTNLDAVIAITINQVYYKIFVTFALYLIDVWILAFTISAVYTRFRNFYQFDYHVINLTTFLKDSGLCPTLTNDVKDYTEQLWKIHRGNWLPELAFQGPACLREDLFVALYIHHLNIPLTFRELPYYFKRQLAARLERTVIFPGKYIVQQGDVFNVTYFIHEGEVEKWCNNGKGEDRFISLLYANGYFGCMPGLFSTASFQFSYYTRTVVDLVYLRLQNWKDLLEGYPEIKKTFYESTRALKQERAKSIFGYQPMSSSNV